MKRTTLTADYVASDRTIPVLRLDVERGCFIYELSGWRYIACNSDYFRQISLAIQVVMSTRGILCVDCQHSVPPNFPWLEARRSFSLLICHWSCRLTIKKFLTLRRKLRFRRLNWTVPTTETMNSNFMRDQRLCTTRIRRSTLTEQHQGHWLLLSGHEDDLDQLCGVVWPMQHAEREGENVHVDHIMQNGDHSLLFTYSSYS